MREMAEQGISFGAHTKSHPILARESKKIIDDREAKEALESKGIALSSVFAYPNGQPGDWNEDVEQVVARTGLSSADSPRAARRSACPQEIWPSAPAYKECCVRSTRWNVLAVIPVTSSRGSRLRATRTAARHGGRSRTADRHCRLSSGPCRRHKGSVWPDRHWGRCSASGLRDQYKNPCLKALPRTFERYSTELDRTSMLAGPRSERSAMACYHPQRALTPRWVYPLYSDTTPSAS
jgi:hypothetical protein